ncbi:hypothetical protein PAE9249_03584 [Paenibacillus sp. CECT 9249]|uniref:hypothetical protein n=1 Tax=Paenibacillus sp. CECT 9249 TaxID=2845385 RepID=UPI001E508BD7|nr:hypothetical protein [Paenibacillus sp. CECT 9249]CAH0121058.1 hypothetical protein PAE9249_03584 [Paenibacillus sp. CECT 9249]
MPDLTPRLGLKKPLGNENVTLASFNENYDILDAGVATKSDLDSHNNAATAHGATPEATANRIVQRNEAGQFKVGAPTEANHVARKQEIDDTLKAAQDYTNEKMSDAGKVKSVNGMTGDVVLTAENIGAETPAGAQAKANQAEANAKAASLSLATGGVVHGDVIVRGVNLISEIQNLKQSGVDAKNKIAGAISAKGVPASANDDWSTLSNKIGQIEDFVRKMRTVPGAMDKYLNVLKKENALAYGRYARIDEHGNVYTHMSEDYNKFIRIYNKDLIFIKDISLSSILPEKYRDINDFAVSGDGKWLYIIRKYVDSSNDYYDVFLSKVSADGVLAWTKKIGYDDEKLYEASVATNRDGSKTLAWHRKGNEIVDADAFRYVFFNANGDRYAEYESRAYDYAPYYDYIRDRFLTVKYLGRQDQTISRAFTLDGALISHNEESAERDYHLKPEGLALLVLRCIPLLLKK